MRASILFFMSLVYLNFCSHTWSTCLLIYLSFSLVSTIVCQCWPGFGENHSFLDLVFVHVSIDS